MNAPATIRAADLELVLAAARALQCGGNRSVPFAAYSRGAAIEVDCSSGRAPSAGLRADAIRFGRGGIHCGPMQRGWIARVYERVRLAGGRREVVRTWGAGIRELRSEPRYVLSVRSTPRPRTGASS